MKRVPEAELMDEKINALAYAEADFSEPNANFIALFSEKFPAFGGGSIADLGCGPADITMRFAARYPQARVTGFDGADSMLDIARGAVLKHGTLSNRVALRKWHIGRDKNPFGPEMFQAIVSNSSLHHMQNPLDLWRAIPALAAPRAAVLVMDLFRPESRIEAQRIVETYAGNEPDVLKSDFLNSLLAAYQPAEIKAQLAAVNLESLQIEAVSDRHLIIFGSIG